MNTLIVFSAQYLFLLSVVIFAGLFYQEFIKDVWKRFSLISLSVLASSFLLSLAARALYFNPRPFVVEGVEPLIPHVPDNGFPSDHTLLLAALAASAGFINRKAALGMWIIVFVVGLARAQAGVHHAADILGSIVIALISKWLVYFVLKRWGKV